MFSHVLKMSILKSKYLLFEVLTFCPVWNQSYIKLWFQSCVQYKIKQWTVLCFSLNKRTMCNPLDLTRICV